MWVTAPPESSDFAVHRCALGCHMYGRRVERPSDCDSPHALGTIAGTKRRLLGMPRLFVAVSLDDDLTACHSERSGESPYLKAQ